MEIRSRRQLATIVATCFFISGFTGLVYQVLWVRILSLVFGATNLAISTVLTAFMGGLALGSFLGGRYADRMRRPLVAYGILQVIIGVYGFLVPSIFHGLTPLHRAIWSEFHPSFWTFSLFRFGVAGLVLIVPTTAMGATLPVLSRFFARQREQVGFDIGRLYSLNTFGAVFGVLAPAFVLIPALGVTSSLWLAAILSMTIGALVIVVGWPERAQVSRKAVRVESPPSEAEGAGDWRTTVALVGFGVSGFAGLTYEIAYARFLVQVVPSTTYAFTVMLAAFLVGLALGSIGGSYISRRSTNELFLLGAVQLFVGVAVYASTWLFKEMPYLFFGLMRPALGTRNVSTIPLFAASFLIVFPPTLFMGAMFPLVVKLCTRDVRFVGRSVGVAFAANTIGSIVGSFAAGFLLLPRLGLMGTFVVGMSLNLILATVLVSVSYSQTLFKALAWAAVAVGLLNVFAVRPDWRPTMLTGGRYDVPRERVNMGRAEFARAMWRPESAVLAHKDGVEVTVTVMQDLWRRTRALLSNGRAEGSTHLDMPTQVLLAAVPLAILPEARDVLIIGFGTGTTVGSVLNFPETRAVAAELEETVIEFSRFFEPINGSPLREAGKRLTVEVNDARNLLLMDPRRYDLIISEPSTLCVAGISNLFSADFYSLAKSRLGEDGVFAQWLQGYSLSRDTLRATLRTFSKSFEWTYVFQLGQSDYCLVGAAEPLWVDTLALERRLSEEAVREDLARVAVTSPADLMATFLLGPEEIKEFVAEGPINTDDNLYLELQAPKDYWLYDVSQQNLQALLGISPAEYPHLLYAGGNEQRQKWLLDLAKWRLARRHYPVVVKAARRALSLGPSLRARSLLAEALLGMRDTEGARNEWNLILREDPEHVPTLLRYARDALGANDTEGLVSFARRAATAEPENAMARFYLGLGLFRQGLKVEAAAEFDMAAKDPKVVEGHPEVLYNLGFCELDPAIGNYESAAKHLEDFTKAQPTDAPGFYCLGAAKYYLGKTEEAIAAWQMGSLLARAQSLETRDRARMLAGSGDLAGAAERYREAISTFSSDRAAYVELAQVLWRSAKAEETIKAWEAMLEVFPDDPQAYFRMGQVYEWKGDADAAMANYLNAAKLAKDPSVLPVIQAAIDKLRLQITRVGSDSEGERAEE